MRVPLALFNDQDFVALSLFRDPDDGSVWKSRENDD
jgi:hypothetical protein